MAIPLELYTGDAIGVLADWDRDDAYNHARSDLSTYYDRLRFAIGVARRANPQRPNMNAGAGRLTLIGEDFVPGRSGVLTQAQLRQRTKIKLNLGAIGQFEGWMQEGRSRDGNATEFKLEGLLERRSRREQQLSQNSAATTTTDATVVQLLEDAYGLDSIPINLEPIPLSLYNFSGPAGQYASLFGLVSGGLPTARGDGSMVLRDPRRRPAGIPTFRVTDYLVLDGSSEFDLEQIRNVATVIYPGQVTEQTAAGVVPQSVGIDNADTTLLPLRDGLPRNAPTSGSDILFMHHRARTAQNDYSYPVTLTAPAPTEDGHHIRSGRFRIRSEYWSGALHGASVVNQQLDAALRQSGLYDMYIDGVVQDDGSLAATINDRFPHALGSNRMPWRTNVSLTHADAVYSSVQAELTIQVPGQNPIHAVNNASITDFDPRELILPGWLVPTAQTALQARIDDLAQPRDIFTQGYSMYQGDAERTRAIARLQPGDHIGIFDRDPPSETDINAIVYVMLIEYDIRRRQLPIKRVVGLQSGAGRAVDHHPVFAGSDQHRIYAGSTDHPVFALG